MAQAISSVAPATPQAPASRIGAPRPHSAGDGLTTQGSQILLNGQPWWFVGYNSFVWSGDCGNGNEKMTSAQVDSWFASMRHDGHGMARLFFFRGWNLKRLEQAIASAKTHNIYLAITLDDAIAGCGESKKNSAWFADAAERADFKGHMTTLLKRFKGERRIAWFEYFNEPGADGTAGQLRQFYDEMGAVAESIDPARLFASGTVAPYWLGDNENSLDNPNFRSVSSSSGVDIVSIHEYDQHEIVSNHLDNTIANAAGKPVMVGEFGLNANESGAGCEFSFAQRAPLAAQKANAYIRTAGCAGALLWAWQPGGAVGSCGYGTVDRDTATQDSLRNAAKP